WGQYRAVVQSAGTAAGVGPAFARNGFAVDGVPEAGAIMVWPGGAYGAAGPGHVAIVVAVYRNGTVLVRHENWPVRTRDHAQVFTVRPGHRFVHASRVRRADGGGGGGGTGGAQDEPSGGEPDGVAAGAAAEQAGDRVEIGPQESLEIVFAPREEVAPAP